MNRQTARGPRNLAAPPRPILAAAGIAAVALLAYLPAIRGGFFWDDYSFLAQNPLIEAPDGLRYFWFSARPSDYFPLTSTALWFEWRLWGVHPAGYHAVNVLLHAACALLVWRILRRLAVPGAWVAGLLFALHPVAAASAAWISELKNTLSLALCLASLLAFLKFEGPDGDVPAPVRHSRESGNPGRLFITGLPNWIPAFAGMTNGRQFAIYGLSLVLFLLALLAKTSVVMLPAVLLLCAWWRRGRISRKDLLRSVPFFALSLALGLVTVWFQGHNAIEGLAVRPEGFGSRLAAAGWIVWFYLYKTLLPAGLCAIYPRWDAGGACLRDFVPLILLAGGMALLWARRKSWGRAPLFAAAYFVVMLLPVLGFAQMSFMRFSLVGDQFQYAAMIGAIAFAAALLAPGERPFDPALRDRHERQSNWRDKGARRSPRAAAAACCAAVLGLLACRRAALYGNARLLWQDNAEKNPAGWGVWNMLGHACLADGLPDEAIRSFDKAMALEPHMAELYCNRGEAYAAAGRIPEAMRDYGEAIVLQPGLAAAYEDRGSTYAMQGRYDDALRDCETAVQLQPDSAAAYNDRGSVYLRSGRPADAVPDYGRAISLKAYFPEAYFNRAVAYAHLGKLGEAVSDYSEAIRQKPDYYQACNNRGKIFADLHRLPEAIRDYRQAVSLNPEDAEALYNLGNALSDAGRLPEAIREYGRAIALRGDYREAYNNRAVAWYRLGRCDRALADVKTFEKLGGKPSPEFLKALAAAGGRSK